MSATSGSGELSDGVLGEDIVDVVEQLRALLPTVKPELLTEADRVALVDLLAAVYRANSERAVANFG